MQPPTGPPELTQDLLAPFRPEMRRLSKALDRACRGLVVDHGVGFDPAAPPEKAWWATCRVQSGRAVRRMTVEGYGLPTAALAALLERVDPKAKRRAAAEALAERQASIHGGVALDSDEPVTLIRNG